MESQDNPLARSLQQTLAVGARPTAPSYPQPSYVFEARTMGEPYDGDTFPAMVRLGFRVIVETRIRLYGVNCPERYIVGSKPRQQSIEGLAALYGTKGWLAEAAAAVGAEQWPLVIDSRSFAPDDKYGGRSDAIVWRKSDGTSLQSYLLARGLAVPMSAAS